MSTINDTDLLLVERNGVQYQITYDQMSTLNDDDLLLVERGGVQYKVEAQHVSTGANGLIIPPVEVLTPVNGAGITEFTTYEPVSSAITAVGENGTIAKDTDEILSVAVEAPIASWNIADGSSPSFANTDINFATELAARGVTAITGINLYLDNVSGYPYTSNLSGFTLNNVDLVAAAQVSLISYNGTPYNNSYGWVSFFNGGGYNQCQGTTTYTCLFQPYPLGTVAKLKVLSVGGRVSLLDQDGAEHFIIGSSVKKVLSFPTNTNFSGLSVGDVVQGGTVESPVMIATHSAGGTDFVIENFESVNVTSTSSQTPSTFDHATKYKSLCFYLSDPTSDVEVNMGGSGWVTHSSVDGVNWVQGTTHSGGAAMARTLSSNNPNAKYFLIGAQTPGYPFSDWAQYTLQPSFISNWNPPYTLEMPVGGSIEAAVEITAIDAAATPPTVTVDGGTWTTSDRLTSQISYEKSLTFTDDTQLANMVGPLEMTDANGDVVTPVSDTIASVSGNVLTLQGDTNLAYFQPGDEVQTGVQVVSVDAAAPSITVDGGSWLGADGSGSTYEISKSLRFNSADSSYMHWTPSSAGNQKTWTWSGWVKRVNFGEECVLFSGSASPGANYYLTFSGGTGTGTGADGLSFFYGYGIHVGTAANAFRDPNAWYHIVVAVDTTQSTPAERVKIYVNGTEVTYSYTNYPSENADLGINSSYRMSMGAINSYAAWSLSDMYLADVHFIDGQALAPTAFGDFDSNGVWQAKEADISSYGTNGFNLNFSDSSSDAALGYDAAGSNDWTVNNLTNASVADSPTSNHATLNQLLKGSSTTIANGNLEITGANSWNCAYGGFKLPTSGKWYWEVQAGGGNTHPGICLASDNHIASAYTYPSHLLNFWGVYAADGNKYRGPGNVSIGYGSPITSGDIIGLAFDADAGTLTFYINGVSQGVAFTGLYDEYIPVFGVFDAGAQKVNFGQLTFAYPVSDFEALTLANFPEAAIKDSTDHFGIVEYTGNGGTQAISGLNFSPDLLWIKPRSLAYNHRFFDTVRGTGGLLYSNTTDAETSQPNSNDNLASFDSDGFTLGAGIGINTNNSPYVAWAWNAGDTTETIAAGDLTSSIYDQSQTWSNNAVTTGNSGNWLNVTNLFNGDLSTYAHANANASDVEVTITFSPALTVSNTVTLYGVIGGAASSATWNVNNEATTALYNDLSHPPSLPIPASSTSFSGSLSSITIERTSASAAGLYLYGIEVDGKMLVDPGVSVDAVPSMASQVRANPAAGFSIVKWTCNGSEDQSIGHGLGTTPAFMIFKNLDRATNWTVYHKDATTTTQKVFYLNGAGAVADYSGGSSTWWGALPTSSVFTVGDAGTAVNHTSGDEMISYCFSPVSQFSAMGKYSGNGSTDGPFVYTNFKPAWVLIKKISNAGNWAIYDTERSDGNPAVERLYANTSGAEDTGTANIIDVLSNGFKLRGSHTQSNGNGETYIYMAIAGNPLNTTPEADANGDTQVALDALVAAATEIVETDGTTMYLNGATGPWRTGLSIEGSQINAAPPGPSEITFTSQNQGTPAFSGVDATLASRTWTLESGTTATGPWTLIDTYADYGVLSTQTGATPWTENKPTLQPNTFYRIKVQYDSTNAPSVESVYNTFKTGDA